MSKYLWMIAFAARLHQVSGWGWRRSMTVAREATDAYPLDWPEWDPADAADEELSYWSE